MKPNMKSPLNFEREAAPAAKAATLIPLPPLLQSRCVNIANSPTIAVL